MFFNLIPNNHGISFAQVDSITDIITSSPNSLTQTFLITTLLDPGLMSELKYRPESGGAEFKDFIMDRIKRSLYNSYVRYYGEPTQDLNRYFLEVFSFDVNLALSVDPTNPSRVELFLRRESLCKGITFKFN